LQFCLTGGTRGITCQCNGLYSHWQNKLPPLISSHTVRDKKLQFSLQVIVL
jgi:hypothetical protein